MNKILLLTHYGWGIHLLKSIQMIIGKVDYVEEIPLNEITTFEEYVNLVREKIKDNPSDYLIIVDMFGGTPSHTASLMARDYRSECICGLNAPLLLGACSQIMSQGSIDIDALLADSENSIFDLQKKIGLKGD